MERVKLVLVGVEGSVNLGFILRLAKNFNVGRIVLVSPRELDYEVVERYSAKARDLIRHLRVVDELDKAFEPEEMRVCTSSRASEDDPLRQPMSPKELAQLYAGTGTPLALVFGRESTGLTREELAACHSLVTIEANPEYPVLNLSHAVAIILYKLYTARPVAGPPVARAGPRELGELEEAYRRLLEMVVRDGAKRERLALAFTRMVSRSPPTRLEARSLLCTLRRAARRLEECGGSGVGESTNKD